MCVAVCAASGAVDSVRITVQPGAKQVFMGLGANAGEFDNQINNNDGKYTFTNKEWVPEWIRDTLTSLVFMVIWTSPRCGCTAS
jgi:hypothetical protein